ncbi:MAG: Gfo/Idh/MocA family oxidoreductase [Planctomycetales bacterium]|nr:Gfo/Idh/MocA family oxidoreductase [Planctomycetales bacterium]
MLRGGSLNRRSFVHTSATAAATLAFARSAAANRANNKLVAAVMGTNGRGSALARSFLALENTEVAYICDPEDGALAKGMKAVADKQNNTPDGVKDFRRALDDQGVDLLICAAPNHWHAPATILACSQGKHVYVEKPCSHNPWEGEMMVAAARKHGRSVQIGTQRRSSPGTRLAMERLRSGAIGKPYLARAYYNNSRGSIGQGKTVAVPEWLDYELWQGPAPRRPYLDNVVHYNWHWRWHWGNGELGNNGVHTLDLCRWGLGVTYPTQVTSTGGRYVYQDDQETPDTHTVGFTFPDECAITWQGLSCNRHGEKFVEFYGTEGTIELDSNGNFRLYDRHDKLQEQVDDSRLGEADHVANFLQAVRGNRPDGLHAEILEGHRSTLLCHLGNIAQRVGRALTCDPQNGSILHDEEAVGHWKREYAEGWEPAV